MTVRLHDTLSRRLQTLQPLEPGNVRLYTCGPTVYARSHIGNFRTFIFEDVLRRWLERRFERVSHVMNLTDVDDKIIRNAAAHGHDLDAETAPWIAAFFEDVDALNIRRAHHYPRATAYIPEMCSLIERLEAAGVTYRTGGSIYFRIDRFPAYGRLAGVRPQGLVAGAGGRVDADEYDKEDARDFALWKAVGPDDIGWDTALGRGRPGWHIECSAMSMALLGESFDIHCGGVDNVFPHHENEIAQSEAATGRPFVKLWCHSAHLRLDGEKMAKSLGNVATVPDLLAEGHRPSTIRYLLAAGAHYRRTLNFSDEALHAAAESVQRVAEFAQRIAEDADGAPGPPDPRVAEARLAFAAAMDDDLNLPEGMGVVFSQVREVNRALDAGAVSAATRHELAEFIAEVDDVLGILDLVALERGSARLSDEEQQLVDARAAARSQRRWDESDRLRDRLLAAGIVVEDTPQGQRWRRV